ncbi:AF4/FMR2 family member 3-like isoform X2 [Ornithodoros turicata]|uniref:AF4/FMR2 family member 3-like isoform X2 n=1 Tax=Ornithodoros turicata TaxID=34597 RepID=UPI0031389450
MAMSLPPQAFPWIANSSVERDALRERERQARAQRAGLGSGDPGGHPIFRAPIRVDPGQEDEISRRLRSTLGDFSQVQPWLSHDPNHLIGISRTGAAAQAAAAKSSKAPAVAATGTGGPLTASAASTWNGAATDPGGSRVGDPSSHHNPSSKHPPAAHHGSSSSASNNHHRSHTSSTTRHHPHHHHKKHQPPLGNGQLKPSSSHGKSTTGNNGGSARPPQQPSQHQPMSSSSSSHHQRSRTASEQGRGDDVDKGSSKVPLTTSASNGHVVRAPTLRAPSKDVNNGVTAAPPTSSATNTSSSQSSSLSIRTESSQKVSVSTSSSLSSRPAPPVVQEPKAKRPQPKLVIPPPETLESNPCASHPELESILKEMQKVPPPLTAIETPRKEDCRITFPLSPVQDLDSHHLDDNDSKPVDRRKYASPPGSLQDDLEMSDSDDDELQSSRKSLQGLSASKISASNDNVSQPPASREKDSDSSDSEGSSSASGSDSESESSSSDASLPEANGEPNNTQGWMLSNFLNKPSSPATVGALPSRSNSVVHHPDSLIDEDSFTPILSQCPNPDADLGLMLKSPSPQGFDLVRSPKAKGTSNLLLSPVNSSPSHSPLLPRQRSPDPTLARRTSTSDDDAPCHVQNRRVPTCVDQTPPPHQPDRELPPTKPALSTPEQPRKPWASKGAKKMTSPTVPTLKRSKAELKEIPVREEEPVMKTTSKEASKTTAKAAKESHEASRNRAKAETEPAKPSALKRRTHSERRSEKRSKIHKSRVVLSESSSEDETSKDCSDDDRKHTALAPVKLSRSENRPRSSSKTSLAEKVPPQTPPEPIFSEPSAKLEPPQLLSPIAQRCGSEAKENIEPPAQQECVLVSLALNRLLRLPGGKQCPLKGKGRSGDTDSPDESQNKADALRQVYSGTTASTLPSRESKSSLKRKGGGDESAKEKRRRLSSSSSASLWVKQEPPEPPPEEEADSQPPWSDIQARPPPGCDSPSSLSSFSSQRSGSRQHRSKSLSKSCTNSHSEQPHQVKKEPKESQEKQKKSHRDRKEGSGSSSSKSRSKIKQEVAALANQEEERSSVRVQGSSSCSSISSSQAHLWDGLLSSSEPSKANETPGGTSGGSGGQLNPTLKPKEETSEWSRNPQLLSGTMHRDLDTKSYSSDYYLAEAKNLKHQADKETDRTVQSMKYLEAVLFFILTGSSMERNHADLDKVYTMYKETLSLIRWAASSHKHISPKFQKLQNNVLSSIDNKLAILSLRCQSLLYQKLYKLRKNEVRKNLRALSDFQKSNPGKMASPAQNGGGLRLQPSPCQPSPHSPTPSPAGSVGSQSSGYSSELGSTNGIKNGSCSSGGGGTGGGSAPSGGAPAPLQPPSVAVPQAQYLMLQRQSATLTNLHRCHDLWEQADYLVAHNHLTDFFEELDKVCGGKLTLHSSSSELVKYVREGILRLRNKLPGQDAT